MPVQIAKVGAAVDGAGNEFQFTPSILRDLQETYSPKDRHRAPFLENHDESQRNKGLVTSLKVEGDRLFADSADMDRDFAAAVNSGRIPSLSPALYHPQSPNNPTPGRWHLRHVAGVQIPGIKGMLRPEFSEGDGGTVYLFGEVENPVVALARRLRMYFMDEFNPETAEVYIPQALLENFELMAGNSSAGTFEEGAAQPTATEATDATAVADPPPADLDALASELDAKAKELEDKEAELAKRVAELNAQEDAEFMERQIREGFTPAMRDLALSLLGSADNTRVLVFGEGEAKTELTQKDQIKQLIGQVRIPTTFAEVSGGPDPRVDAGDPVAVAKAAQTLVDQAKANGQVLSAAEAVKQVTGG